MEREKVEGGREGGWKGGRKGGREEGREGEVQLEQEHEGKKVGMGDTIQVHLSYIVGNAETCWYIYILLHIFEGPGTPTHTWPRL